ncbi:hypothetical protein C0585_06850 [Candidatus Woesearchaeota archaeon]|nr:MAG: hypothetical protein C0585_06850 [Candidatus Woesearchaeota archaeon]
MEIDLKSGIKNNIEKKVFIDTNIFIYAYNNENSKRNICLQIVKNLFKNKISYISIQTLSELSNVLLHKMKLSNLDLNEVIYELVEFGNLCEIKSSTIIKAIDIHKKFKIHFFDAQIVATMIQNGVDTIYTENVKDFSKVPFIKAINPLDI